MLKPSAIMQPMPYSEREFWLKVRRIVGRSRDLLAAIERVRDRDGIHQNHIASLSVRLNYTCWRKYQKGWNFLKKKHARDLITAHLEKLEK